MATNAVPQLPDFLSGAAQVYWNLTPAQLISESIRRGESEFEALGGLVARTGMHTGRSPKDRFIVRDSLTEDSVAWGGLNQPIEADAFDKLTQRMASASENLDLFCQDLTLCADPAHETRVRVVTQFAWHNLFARNLYRVPSAETRQNFVPDWTVISIPSAEAVPSEDGTRSSTFILVNFTKRQVIVGGTQYAGEIKKSMFSVLNFLLPSKNVLPMHCSANQGEDGSTALFFGLSGTGKTTLSSDEGRTLIGDDEHGWSENGIFNLEGGCYAKAVDLTAEREPQIYAATRRFGSVLENVVLDAGQEPDFSDTSLTENTRCAYPLEHLDEVVEGGMGQHPNHLVFLSMDAFGVLPPVALLTPEQALSSFLLGYTAKTAGTEIGITEPQAAFSACFGAPFIPRAPVEYARLLGEKIAKHSPSVWLVNTGWTGGGYGVGNRIPLSISRRLIRAILAGELSHAEMVTESTFGLAIPARVEGVDAALLNPRDAWSDKAAYDTAAEALKARFAAAESELDTSTLSAERLAPLFRRAA